MSKIQINTFTLSDSHGVSLETIKEHALDSARRREEWDCDPNYYYDSLEVEVTGPHTQVYYDVKVFGEKICTHPTDKIKMEFYSSPEKGTGSVYKCECGMVMKPKEFEVVK